MRVILLKQGSTFTNITHLVDKYHSKGIELDLDASSEIYIGSLLPHNHIYINLSSPNDNTIVSAWEYWDGTQFRTAPQFVDETEVGGATLNESGYMSFVPDQLYPWLRQDTKNIPDMSNQVYYDLYWSRLTFGGTLTTDVRITFIGQVFCTDAELYGEFYKFTTSDFLDAWGDNKTDWLEQRIIASDILAGELRTQGKIETRDQIIDRYSLKDACVQKTAAIIFQNSGNNYAEETLAANTESARRLNYAFSSLDRDKDGIKTRNDLYRATRWVR